MNYCKIFYFQSVFCNCQNDFSKMQFCWYLYFSVAFNCFWRQFRFLPRFYRTSSEWLGPAYFLVHLGSFWLHYLQGHTELNLLYLDPSILALDYSLLIKDTSVFKHIYSKGRIKETVWSFISWYTSQMPAITSLGPGWSQELYEGLVCMWQ